jgi:hypothetical protein
MTIEDAKRYIVDNFFGPGPIFDNLLARFEVRKELVRRDFNGVGIESLRNGGLGIVVFSRRPTTQARPIVEHISRQTGFQARHLITGEFQAGPPIGALRTQPVRPAPGGVSIGHYAITAGTLGCLVKDSIGNIYILSNNHVLANTNRASIGDRICQPGPDDNGRSCDQLGSLHAFKPLVSGVNYIDGALALPLTPYRNYVRPDILSMGYVNGEILPRLEMNVKKSGRTTGLTQGIISILKAYVQVNYGHFGTFTFDDQIVIEPGQFSSGGDSGSLVVDSDNRAVGLLFAGSGTFTLANPFHYVRDFLGVRSVVGIP